MKKEPGFTQKEREWLEAEGYGDVTRDIYEETWAGHFATDKGASVELVVYKDKEQKTWVKACVLFTDADGCIEVCHTAHDKTLKESVTKAMAGIAGYMSKDLGLA